MPNLFSNWLELFVWALFSLAFALSSAVAVVCIPSLGGAALGGLLLTTHTFIVWRKFKDRWRDVRSVAFRTVQGVSVIYRNVPRLAQIDIEVSLERAIAAHGHRAALSGWCIVITSAPVYAGPARVHGVADSGYISISRGALSGRQVLGLVTHEASHVLLRAEGVPTAQHHAVMAERGTI